MCAYIQPLCVCLSLCVPLHDKYALKGCWPGREGEGSVGERGVGWRRSWGLGKGVEEKKGLVKRGKERRDGRDAGSEDKEGER